jgi:hypothetical protein
MSHKDQSQTKIVNHDKLNPNGTDVNPMSTDQDMEVSEIGKPVIDKKIPKNVPGIDTGQWED